MIPGLIDNHMHLLRYGTTWKYEVRWDGVETRKEALELLRARTQTVKPGDWIYILGGWALEQFADDAKPFTREELDRVAPNHPVFLQASYLEAFVNSRALQLLGVDAPTGHLDEDAFRPLVNKLPLAGDVDIEASIARHDRRSEPVGPHRVRQCRLRRRRAAAVPPLGGGGRS